MKKLSAGICLVAQNTVEGRTPHKPLQVERPQKIQTQTQARAA
ncbi:hypothetical protein PH552_12165 [Rhizobium sp. CNPSo 3968]|nr:hypothetical protein [Rhizobium sp. CNPSo 3968]MDK4720099.1 hypothetical protein [Rhizobium sp. CNPSo 3968]